MKTLLPACPMCGTAWEERTVHNDVNTVRIVWCPWCHNWDEMPTGEGTWSSTNSSRATAHG